MESRLHLSSFRSAFRGLVHTVRGYGEFGRQRERERERERREATEHRVKHLADRVQTVDQPSQDS